MIISPPRKESTAIQGCERVTEERSSRTGIYRIRESRSARDRVSPVDVDVRQHYYKLHGDTRRYDLYQRIIGQTNKLFTVAKLPVADITYPRTAHNATISSMHVS